MTKEELEVLKRIEALLIALLRVSVSDKLAEQLKDPKRRRLYELTGKCTSRELALKVGLSQPSVSRIWQEWEAQGLVVKDGQKYRRLL